MIETPNTFPGLFWGYLVVWGLLSVYILWIGSRLKRLEDASRDRSETGES